MVNVILILILAAVIAVLIVHMVKQHRTGNDCSCGCENCRQNCRKKDS